MVRGEPGPLDVPAGQRGLEKLLGMGTDSGVGEGHSAWCSRSDPKDCMGSIEDILTELPQHREPEALQQYLRKVRAQAWGGLLYLTAWC